MGLQLLLPGRTGGSKEGDGDSSSDEISSGWEDASLAVAGACCGKEWWRAVEDQARVSAHFERASRLAWPGPEAWLAELPGQVSGPTSP